MKLTDTEIEVQKPAVDPREEALFAWMQEVSGVIFYQADIAQSHKEDIGRALEKYAKARAR